MKKQLVIVGLLACSFANNNVFAQEKQEKLDEVVVTATKFNLKKENTGKVIHKITAEELENSAGKTVLDVLNTIVGIDVRGVNTNPTEPKSVYVRGGRNRQVLILIDGVPVSDASAISQEYDLRLLSLNQIESIEVLKGASSTLYGSGAATGVINIILKKASKDKVTVGLESSLETNNTAKSKGLKAATYQYSASVNGTVGGFNFVTMLGATETYGMSSAKSNTASDFEADAFTSENGLLKLGYNFNKKFAVETFFNYDKFDYDFDAGAFRDSDVNTGDQEQYRYGIRPSFKYNNGEFYALVSLNKITRNLNQYNSFGGTLDAYVFEGNSVNLDLVNKYDFKSTGIQLIAGLNYQNHTNNSVTPFATIDKDVAKFNTIDPYISAVYISDSGLSVNVGGRLNMHSVYDNHFVYDGNVAYSVLKDENKSVKLLTSYSTAFIAPSLYQLYDGFSGNLDLKPESNKTFEIGTEATFKDFLELSVVYFNRKEEDAIIYDNTTFKYGNGSSDANGIEVSTSVKPVKDVRVNIGYTYVDKDTTEDFDDYIPKNKLVASVDVSLLKNTFFNLTYNSVGERSIYDRYGSFGTAGDNVILDNYDLLDFNVNYKAFDNKIMFFGSVTNLLNEDYSDVLGYNTKGVNYKLGFRLQL
ncbi:TonB-dependent receptor plug domain-containing protein [Tenacibaculum aquimarinum]|uniref:TonB-dependent receptor plug domain-containing protein n=2 Tax=Tenacibaculum aquimarinum TaxID=2910675 RepID=UPI001F0A6FC1|nr:TonB-dependent receptor [Tenacibaculum aquimarinum]MCH3882276.1 TonB-dependent receptor [Tenacibaculum aquimarinum]